MKKIITIIATLTILTGLVGKISAEKMIFTDVSEEHWGFECINEMVDRNVLSGYPDGTFRPDEYVSRAEFARMISSAAGFRAEPVRETSFADVKPTDWYASFIESVKDFLSGYSMNGASVYEPDKKALREDIVVALVKLVGYNAKNADWDIPEFVFADEGDISEDAQRYIKIAYAKGLVAGYEDNTFRPKNAVTRAEAAALLKRACPKAPAKPEATPEPTVEPEKTPAPTPTVTPTPTNKPEEPDEPPHSLETTFAIVQKGAHDYITEEGDDVKAVQVLYKGEKNEILIFADGLYEESGLGVGDVFFFGTDRFGYVDEIFPIYDYSEDEFKHLESKNWSSNLWNEGADYQLAEGYIVEVAQGAITLAPRSAIEAGYLDISIDIDDDHENGVGVFALAEDGFAYEFDAFNDNIVGMVNRLSVKDIDAVKASGFDKYETRDGIYEGDLVSKANYAIVIVEDGVVAQIYTVRK